MIIAVHHGGSGPLWYAVLIASEEWGCPPWEIAGGDKLTWWFRWHEYASQRAKKAELDAQ